MMSVLFLLVGLGLILSGANFLTNGAAALAKRFNISSLVIGLTIVAFGTSAPELTVSIVSAINMPNFLSGMLWAVIFLIF